MQPQSDDSAHRAEAALFIGEALGDRRRALGLSLDDVAAKLKFMPRQLEALEAGRFERLAGPSFVRGMIRSYARLLDLDPEPLVIRLPTEAPSVDSLAEFVKSKPIPITDTSRGVNLLYGAFSLVIAGVIAAVVWEWQAERSASERMTFVRPSEPAAPRPEPVARTEPIAVATTKLPPVEAPAIAPASPPQAAPSADVSAEPGNRRITLVFDKESWVLVRARDGKVLISQLNPAGSERVVEGLPPFEVVIGNAAHVRVRYDDRDVDLAPHMKIDVARLKLE
jgi:cytoskeleton protein RodZ